MKFQLADVRLLKESVNIIADMVTEVCFKIDKEKISVLATDPANVAMVDFKLFAGAFVDYDVEKPVSLSINLESLKAVMRRASPNDVMIISLDAENNRLKVELVGGNKRTFNLALLDTDNEEQKSPKLKFAARVDLPSVKFDEAIADMEIVSDSVALVAEPERFTVKSEGNTSDAKVELPSSQESTIKMEEDSVSAKYALSYLAKMAKGSKLADNVSIQFAQDYPLFLAYSVPGKMELGFILAPRVSND